MTPEVMVNTLWVLVAAFLVFFMNAGFALVESGLCRAKNTVNILAKNFIVFALAVVGYWSVGYGLMFGGDGAFAGTTGWFLGGLEQTRSDGLPLLAFFFFQLCFAATAATIVSGAVAERIKIASFMVFALVLTAVVYPVVGHWAWGGGWLAEAGFHDFAGSSVVHTTGGWAALAGAVILGPRLGRYGKDGRPRPMPGHNMALVTLGGLVLWLGWFGFNGGSQLAVDAVVAHVSTTTALAAAFGTIVATVWAWKRVGKPDLTLIVNGMLGGLVGVTAGCNVVELYGAAIIGTICGVVVIEAVLFFDRRRVDDPVGAVSVHLVCGALGTILVAVLGRAHLGMAHEGLLYGGGVDQLLIQLEGIGAIGGFVAVVSAIVWLALKATMGIRVEPEEEVIGLDIAEHGMEAYPQAAEHQGPGNAHRHGMAQAEDAHYGAGSLGGAAASS